MKIYQQSASFYLLDKVRTIAGEPDAWRALYFRFSDHPDSFAEGLRSNIIVNIIKDLLKEKEGFIYLLDNGDIAILVRGAMDTVVQALGEQIAGLLPTIHDAKNGMATNPVSQCSYYDLRMAYGPFAAFIESQGALDKKQTVAAAETLPKQARAPVFNADRFASATIHRGLRDRMLVLLVEDDPFTRRLVCNVLKDFVDVVEAENGVDAIERYGALAPDLAFLDIELPDTNGHLLLQQIMAFDADAFLVMLSGNSQKENVIAALEDGAQGFVTKPFAKEKLLHYLKVARTSRNFRQKLTRDHQV